MIESAEAPMLGSGVDVVAMAVEWALTALS